MIKKRKSFFSLIIGFWVFANLIPSYAQSLTTYLQPYFVFVSFGAGNLNIAKAHNVTLAEDIVNRYVANNADENTRIAALGIGRHFTLPAKLAVDVGVTGYYFTHGNRTQISIIYRFF